MTHKCSKKSQEKRERERERERERDRERERQCFHKLKTASLCMWFESRANERA